jgi:hypothetical protein
MSQLAFPIAPPPPRKMPGEPILRAAEIDGIYRWTMTRGWGSGPCIVWTLLNPSTADGKKDDPTTLRMMGFSYRWGFGSMIVTNVYPFISSTTDRLRAWRKTFDHKTYEANGMRDWEMDRTSWSAFHHNQRVISKLLLPETTCVAAWGAGVDPADLDHFLHGVSFSAEDEEFGTVSIDPEWKCLGRTADRSPIHPLARGRHRVPDDAQLKVWKKSQALEPEEDYH